MRAASTGAPPLLPPHEVFNGGQSTSCPTNNHTETIQLIGGSGGSEVVTLNFTKLPAVHGQAGGGPLQYTAQVLVGT